uniref:Recombinase zinc beta ribbon domain-containing protein n=1 Tax=Ditylenchus dipsaci TaxID=166011 RepID=A0A915DQE3_9BILA
MDFLRRLNLYQSLPFVHRKNDNEFQEWLQLLGVLSSMRLCACGNPMRYRRRSNSKQYFPCDRKRCKKEVGFLHDRIFEGAHLSMKEVLS